MARRCPCDACGHTRRFRQRLCDTCFAALPNHLRFAIITAYRMNDRARHRTAKKEARDFLANRIRTYVSKISAQRAYEQTARRMGERDA